MWREKKQVCRLEKSTEKGISVGNEHEEIVKTLIALIVAVKEVVFLVKCLIVLVVLFGSVPRKKKLMNCVAKMSFYELPIKY